MPKVCVFGDSVAKGIVYDDAKKKYVYLKDSFVNMVEEKIQTPIRNFAKFGCTIEKGKDLVRKHLRELSEYDYTVLEFGGNDCDYNWREVATEPDAPHLPNVPIQEFETLYSDMIDDVRESGSKPVLMTLPPLDARRFFNWVSAGLNYTNILKFLGDVEHIYRWHELYNLAVYRIAIKKDVPVIDITTKFLLEPNCNRLLCADGMHPNADGHKLIVSAINEALPAIG